MRERRIGRQGGWVGLIVILLALVIVAMLAKDALKQYGLMPGAAPPMQAGSPGERARAPAASGLEAFDPGTVQVAPTAPMDRARGLEESVRQQASDRAARSLDAGK
jgi:hypothetical protein